jgi:hypothetical protein
MTTTHALLPTSRFLTTAIDLAQAAFTSSMPSAYGPTPVAPPAAERVPRLRWLDRLDNWFARQEQREREAYLAQSADIFELEQRIRRLERVPYPYY